MRTTSSSDQAIVKAMIAMNSQLQDARLRDANAAFLRGEQPRTRPDKIRQQILSGDQAAEILHLSRRSVQLLAKSGTIQRAVLPGRTRAFGYTRASVEALAEGGAE